jgi:hypothetical protein
MTAPADDLVALAGRVRRLRRLRAADGERFAVAVDDVVDDLHRLARAAPGGCGTTQKELSGSRSRPWAKSRGWGPKRAPVADPDADTVRRLRALVGAYDRENRCLRAILATAARPSRRPRQRDDGRQLALALDGGVEAPGG